MNKKGMGIGQVFIFIVAAITFALIMIFGYQTVSEFLESGEDVAFVQFKTGLENSVKKIYTEYGSVRIEKFTVPQKYEHVCFVDMNADYDPDLCKEDQVACAVWEDSQGYDSVEENVFLKPISPVKIKVYDISIEGEKDFLCLPVIKGIFELYLEGKGDHTSLAKPE